MSTIVMSNTDPGEGSPLQSDNFLAIYGGTSILDIFYPVGSYYKSADLDFDPNESWGGVWIEDTSYDLVAYVYTNGGSGTTIRASKNVSQVQRTDTGIYLIYFEKTMADADYVAVVSSEAGGAGCELVGVYNKTASRFRIDFAKHDGSMMNQDQINALVYGRLVTPEYRVWKRTA